MRNGFRRVNCTLHFVGGLLEIVGLILLVPLIPAMIYRGQRGDGRLSAMAFALSALISLSVGAVLRRKFKPQPLDTAGSMLICAVGWLLASAMGALPFVMVLKVNFLDAYFEAMSGFTTTGITVLFGLDRMPASILFWRALSEWLGGVGILSFFLLIVSHGGGAHHMLGAESHKISSGRPAPGLFNTLRILWAIYAGLTALAALILAVEKMPVFDAICHAMTALATGGFSPHGSSIGFYRLTSHPHYRLIEYTLILFMTFGGINFLVHYRVLTGDLRALWDSAEIKYWWRLLAAFTGLVLVERLHRAGVFAGLFSGDGSANLGDLERALRHSLFQVVSILTTTGFTTKDISSGFFGPMSKQLFLVMMVVGGCVGSTSGGFKVLRVVILNRLMFRELFKLRTSGNASAALVIDQRIIGHDEIHRVAALFFTWMGLILAGGAVTALLSDNGPLESLSGMFSAVGNIGPCYIPAANLAAIHPVVKITYIMGMLAGRLEILPVLLLFSRKSWR